MRRTTSSAPPMREASRANSRAPGASSSAATAARSAAAPGRAALITAAPAMTSPAGEVYFVRLHATASASGSTSTLNGDATDGSHTTRAPCRQASVATAPRSAACSNGFVGISTITPAIRGPWSANRRSSPARSATSSSTRWSRAGSGVNFLSRAMVSRYSQPSCTHAVRPHAACSSLMARNTACMAPIPLAASSTSPCAVGNNGASTRCTSAAASPGKTSSSASCVRTPARTSASSAAREPSSVPVCCNHAFARAASAGSAAWNTAVTPSWSTMRPAPRCCTSAAAARGLSTGQTCSPGAACERIRRSVTARTNGCAAKRG